MRQHQRARYHEYQAARVALKPTMRDQQQDPQQCVSPRGFLSCTTAVTVLVVLAIKSLGYILTPLPIALAAPTRARAPVDMRTTHLFVRGVTVRYETPQRMCVLGHQEGSAWVSPELIGTRVVGPLWWLGLDFHEDRPNGDIVLRNSAGHIVIVSHLSSKAIVDGKRVELEENVRMIRRPGLLYGPLNTLAPLVGYELKYERLYKGFWVLTYPALLPIS